jgi:hypothetical protein
MTRALVAVIMLAGVAATAHARVMPLERLPEDKLAALAPLLGQSHAALVESFPDGTMKQVTLVMLVAARPETVHDVLVRPGDFKKIVPNVSKSTWDPKGPDRGVSAWQLDLPVSEFDAVNAYHFEPGERGAVNVTSIDNNNDSTYRYEVVAVPWGTVLVQYGYTDVKHSNNFVRGFLKRQPVMEHGLALAAQLLLAEAFKREAERRTPPGSLPTPDPNGPSPGFNFMLERGQVILMRGQSAGNRVSDVSVLDRVFTAAAKVQDAIEHPNDYKRFIPGVDNSFEKQRGAGTLTYEMEMSVPLVSWDTTFALRFVPNTIEGMGIDGDLRGAHFEWNLVPRGGKETLVIYRLAQPLAQGSILVRKLFQFEPSLETGLNVAFGLVYVRAMRGRAEGWKQ